jgi:hypothetical protein
LGETKDLAEEYPQLVAKAVKMINEARTADPDWPDPAKVKSSKK